MKRFAFFLLMIVAGNSHAFPELIRHGYVNCTSCHTSPNGGGMLTPYGRQLSREVLSTWGYDGEERFAYGLVKTPEWLGLQTDSRAVQTYLNNSRVEQSRFIFMQTDLEAAATIGKFTADATVGIQPDTSYNKAGGFVFSRRHFLMYKPTDEISVRAGRFFPAYGVNFADHQLSVRRNLGFDEGAETYNLEGSYIGEKYDFFATVNAGRPDASSLQKDSGIILRSGMAIGDNRKVGLSYFWGTRDGMSRHMFGPYALIGFAPNVFLLFEGSVQANVVGGRTTWQFVDYTRLDYEFFKGIHVYVAHEILGLNLSNTAQALGQSFGVGAQWFPRPHIELMSLLQKRRVLGGTEYSDFAWLLLHFYL